VNIILAVFYIILIEFNNCLLNTTDVRLIMWFNSG